MSKQLAGFVTAATLALASIAVHANLITNGDFESGNLTGWSVFTTTDGSVGGPALPAVFLFDTNGDSSNSLSARFQAGHALFDGTKGGGGIFQTIASGAGTLVISMDIATIQVGAGSNVGGGLFELFVDGNLAATTDLGPVGPPQGSISRGILAANVPVLAGSHEIRVQITRNFVSVAGPTGTPQQHLDNVSALLRPSADAPEPEMLGMVGAGFVLVAFGRRRRRSAAARA